MRFDISNKDFFAARFTDRNFYFASRRGQIMLLTVIAIGATLLAATSVAGMLLIYQIRQTTDFEDSARAIAAADAGIEYNLYNGLCAQLAKVPCPLSPPGNLPNSMILTNGGSFSGTAVSATTTKSVGYFGTVKRAFLVDLSSATTTVP